MDLPPLSADFWALTAILIVMVVISITSSFMVSMPAGIMSLVVGVIYSILVMWNQFCLTSAHGSCQVLAWLYVIGFGLALLVSIYALVALQQRRAAEEKRR
jgi:hypothetical protein